uniref:Heparan-sulfate 6-O-sulfotransferase n=1 Tax=Evadne anonyx TaxID=141404 RepID=A0A9N6ZFJ8_9CRUS|nr:EOG090X0E58 [Evadne anonyx]
MPELNNNNKKKRPAASSTGESMTPRRCSLVFFFVSLTSTIELGFHMLLEKRGAASTRSVLHFSLPNCCRDKCLVTDDRNLKGSISYEHLVTNSSFDIMGRDVVVFLHIQKTGGTTFGRHLVRNLDLDNPCICPRKRKRCDCFRPNTISEQWLFSRYSTGWRCGLHADWTALTNCVENSLNEIEGIEKKRRFYFITVLRDPIHRYISEFRHVQRGATWKSAGHWCGGQEFEFPKCYQDQDWTGVELDEFMNCTHNFAHNRQTRMLADLSLVDCYNSSSIMQPRERNRILLASAKANLVKMAYFGLTDEQLRSQYIFEQTFRLKFIEPFEQVHSSISSKTIAELSADKLKLVQDLNHLDMELYEFGHQLLFQRFNRLKSQERLLANTTSSITQLLCQYPFKKKKKGRIPLT